VAKLLRSQLFPSTTKIEDSATRSFAEKLITFLDDTFRKIANIPFNQSEKLAVADTGNANTEFSVTQYLGRVPNGFILTKSDKACSVYDSGTAWTTTLVYLKCDTANVAIEIYVF